VEVAGKGRRSPAAAAQRAEAPRRADTSAHAELGAAASDAELRTAASDAELRAATSDAELRAAASDAELRAAATDAGLRAAAADAELRSAATGRPPSGPDTGRPPCCPLYHEAIELIGRRWTGAIVSVLIHHTTLRFGEIADSVPELSDRLLSERMKELEARGVVIRTVRPGRPVRVEYELTDMGRELEPAVRELEVWARRWLAQP
jgi:DNA-binding HxlR family transcriptional regulator